MELPQIQEKIYDIRGMRVMLDFDLAAMFEVETRRLNEQVKRNRDRFPADFMIQLTKEEMDNLMSQIATPSWGGTRKLPLAFTEHGVTMLASVLRSERAVQMNIAIVRAFVAMRQLALGNAEITATIAKLEKKMNRKFNDVWQALNFLLDKRTEQGEWEDRNRIGFKQDGE